MRCTNWSRAPAAHDAPSAPIALRVIPAPSLSVSLLETLDRRTRLDPLLAHQEGHLKVEIMRALLSLGFTPQEGSPRANHAHFASPTPGAPDVPAWTSGTRLIRVPDGSSDIVAIKDGGFRQLELKTRCDHGSKSGAATAEIAADLARVAQSDEFTFVGAFDGGIYRSFSGDKVERRGRKATMTELTSALPPAGDLRTGVVHSCTFNLSGCRFEANLIRQDVPGNGIRVLMVIDRGAAPSAEPWTRT